MSLGGDTSARPLTVRLNERRIEIRNCVRSSGIQLDGRLTFRPHYDHIKERVKAVYKVARLACCNLGVVYRLSLIIYKATVETIAGHSASAFAHRASFVKDRSCLRQTQRVALLAMIRTYSTVSTFGLWVLASVWPLNGQLCTSWDGVCRLPGVTWSLVS